MKTTLLTFAAFFLSYLSSAQTVIFHVDTNGIFYVGKNTIVYNGGGAQTKNTGFVENHGNVMIVGSGTDVVRTLDASGVAKTEASGGGNFLNKLNEPANYASTNSTNPATAPVYTYGQLYVTGISQNNITAIINQEYRQVKQGAYQQLGFPFYGKTLSTLNTELGKTFSTVRRSQNEIMPWNNGRVVFDNLQNTSFKFGQDLKPFTYYTVGGLGLDVSSVVRTLKGRPVSDVVTAEKSIQLKDAGFGMYFGPTGNVINEYGGRYNTYLQDGFHLASGGAAWVGNFAKNIYQFGNPYLTNLDLSQIATTEAGSPTDGNNLSNIYGVRLDVSGVQYSRATGGGSTSYKAITFVSGIVTGDVNYQVVRPMGTFVIKLKDNITQPTLDFSTLRRFNYHPRGPAVGYDITSAKNEDSPSTVKQLEVIGLDANGDEVERTYFIVANSTVSGFSNSVKAQVGAFDNQLLGTYEEDAVNGGYDNNNVSYWLYINEANENDFKGKSIKLVNYNSNIVSFKFEIRENAQLVEDDTHLLSQGIGFYYKKEGESTVYPILQNAVYNSVPGNYNYGVEYNLYYGSPESGVLGNNQVVKKSGTLVVYNPEKDNYFVIQDSSWKSADIQVFDMSGKLVHKASNISSKGRYELPLQNLATGYIVYITSDKGEIVTTKILR